MTTTRLGRFSLNIPWEVFPEDMVHHLKNHFTPEQAIEFVRRLDVAMDDQEFSDHIIAYGKKLQKDTEPLIEKDTETPGTVPNAPEAPKPNYKYWAKNADGSDIRSECYAENVGALVADLKRRCLIVINIEALDQD